MADEQPSSAGPNAAEVKALLEALKSGLEAMVVGIFDGAKAWLHASSEKSPGTFWAAFNTIHCLRADWGEWDRKLIETRSVRVDCRCGTHAVEAFMFNRRWILIVLADRPLITGAGKVIEHALDILQQLLPTGRTGRSPPPLSGEPGEGQGPTELGIPVWWIRRRMSH
jgi:hypothetical protein